MEFLYNMFIISKGKIKYIHRYPCTYRRMITEESHSEVFLGKEKHYNFYYKDFFYTDWRNLINAFSKITYLSEKKLEKYWFRGCVNGFQVPNKFKVFLFNKYFFKLVYYKIKYNKNWSPSIKHFELNYQKNKLSNINE